MLQFEWDPEKDLKNVSKHGIDFNTASKAFYDEKRKIFEDKHHSFSEQRFICVGRVNKKIITVSFTYRENRVRIISAGCWRKGIRHYEKTQD